MLNSGFDYREKLGRRAAGRTVFAYLSDRYRHSSPREWRRRIEAGQVFIERAPATAERELASGETLVFRRPPWREPEAPTSFAVFYRDHDLLAGDRLYGANGAALPGETGYLLHAHRLAFRHPRSCAPVEILWPPKLYRGSAE